MNTRKEDLRVCEAIVRIEIFIAFFIRKLLLGLQRFDLKEKEYIT